MYIWRQHFKHGFYLIFYPEVSKMSLNCAICGKEEYTLLQANHKELGTTKLCTECWSKEQSKNKLLSLEGGSCCCR